MYSVKLGAQENSSLLSPQNHRGVCEANRKSSLTLANDQLDAQILIYLLQSSNVHVSSNILLILRRSNCINTACGIVTLSK
jgi:hypothetical protein